MPNSTLDRFVNAEPSLSRLVKPTPELSEAISAPENSEIRKVANDVLGALQYSFANVAAKPTLAVKADTVESIFKDSLQAFDDKRKKNYQGTATELLSSSDRLRETMFGRAGQIKPETFVSKGGFDHYDADIKPVAIDPKLMGFSMPKVTLRPDNFTLKDGKLSIKASGLKSASLERFADLGAIEFNESKGIDLEKLSEIYGVSLVENDVYALSSLEEDGLEEFAVTDKMGFWVNKVKCVDETNPEWWGHDEIAMAGISIDETGDVKKIPEKFIGGGFDDGDSKSYSNWRYHWFSLREGSSWPKTYIIQMILAEKDHGGLSSFLNSLWSKVKGKVLNVLKAAATAAGVALATFLGLPEVGALIGKLLGEAVAWIIDTFVKWIINLFKDDIFPIFTAKVTTPSMSARWHYPNGTWGNPSSGNRYAHFYGHGGHYYVRYYWKFFS